jgi:hypothetical protein
MKIPALLTTFCVVPCLLQAADKSQYSLLNPTPREHMREMSTDRPDTTESPYTVDAGHVQIETTLFGFAKDDGVEGYTFGDVNFKVGLTNRTDLQLIVPFFERESGGDAADGSGIGDLTVRWKWNLWGNDGGQTALALMPFVKTPTAGHDLGNDEVEGGLIIPLSVSLGERVGLGVMAEFDIVHDEASGDHKMDFLNTVTCGFDLTERWGAYIEFVSVATTREDASWEGYANGGLTYAVTDDFVLDAGVVVGVNDAAEDFATFVGFSYRY